MAKILSIGDTGPEVRAWQEYLVSQGYRIQVDGKFGPSTLAATRQMQRKLGVKADGKVGQRTIGRQEQTQGIPLPRSRPLAPPMPEQGGTDVLGGGGRSGDIPFQSSGPEADLAAMSAAGSNRRWQDQMARELQGQYYDARAADLKNQGPPPPFSPSFTDQSTPQGAGTLTPEIVTGAGLASQGMTPNFGAAGDQFSYPGSEMPVQTPPGAIGVGQPPVPGGPQAGNYVDPVKRDAIIRMLLQQAGAM